MQGDHRSGRHARSCGLRFPTRDRPKSPAYYEGMADTISIHHLQWGDGARKVALGVHLMSHVREINVVDLVHFLHHDVWGVASTRPRR